MTEALRPPHQTGDVIDHRVSEGVDWKVRVLNMRRVELPDRTGWLYDFEKVYDSPPEPPYEPYRGYDVFIPEGVNFTAYRLDRSEIQREIVSHQHFSSL